MALGAIKRLVLRDADYDPKADSASAQHVKNEFDAADGYEITYSDEHYHVSHSGRTVSFPFVLARRALCDAVAAAITPKPVVEQVPVVEAPKAVEQPKPLQAQPQKQQNYQHQGKRR